MDKRLIARIARTGGGKLLDMAIDRLLLEQPKPSARSSSGRPASAKPAPPPSGTAASTAKAAGKPASPSITRKVTDATLGNIARRSVPAAIIIGGAVLAKALHDQRKAKKAARTAGAGAGKAPQQGGNDQA